MITIIIFQGIIFVLLILGLRHFMKGHVSGAVGHLHKVNDELMKQQAELKIKIAEANKEYQEKTAQADREIAEKQAEVREIANKTVEEAKQQAEQEKERLINEAVATREQMKQEIMASMEEKAIQHSLSIISEFIGDGMKKQIHELLVEEVLEGLKEVSNLDNFQIDTDTAELEVAGALSDKQKDDIKKILKQKINKEVKLNEKVNSELIGGMVLKFGSFVIDGSLSDRLKGAAAEIKRETARRYQSAG